MTLLRTWNFPVFTISQPFRAIFGRTTASTHRRSACGSSSVRSIKMTSARILFYADAKGSPGTDLTFFGWQAPRERRGTRSIVRTCLRVNGRGALEWWSRRFDEEGVRHGEIFEHDGRLMLMFEDSEGQRLALIDDRGEGDSPVPWDRSPVPSEQQI